MSRRLRVGVVGLGKVAQTHHLPAIAEIDDFELAGVCDLSGQLASSIARRYGLPPAAATTDHRALLHSGIGGGIDAVVIANNHHGLVLRDALTAGVPTLVEKPCTWGLAEASDLVDLASAVDIPVLVGYMRQYDPAVEWLRAQGLADDAYYVRVHNFAGGRHRLERVHPVVKPGQDVDPAAARTETATVDDLITLSLDDDAPGRIAALRTLALLAIHDLNLTNTLLGTPEDGTITAHETPVGTCYTMALTYGDTRCSVEILADFTTNRDWDEQIAFYGPSGHVELDFGSPFVRNTPTILRHTTAAGARVESGATMVSRESPYLRQLAHFRDVLRGEVLPRASLKSAYTDLELVYSLVRRLDVS